MSSGSVGGREKLTEMVAAWPGQPEAALARFLRDVMPTIADCDGPVL